MKLLTGGKDEKSKYTNRHGNFVSLKAIFILHIALYESNQTTVFATSSEEI